MEISRGARVLMRHVCYNQGPLANRHAETPKFSCIVGSFALGASGAARRKISASYVFSRIPASIGAVAGVVAAWVNCASLSSRTSNEKAYFHKYLSSRSGLNFSKNCLWSRHLPFSLRQPIRCYTSGPIHPGKVSEVIDIVEGRDFLVFRGAQGQTEKSASLGCLQDISSSLTPNTNVVLLGEVHDDQVAHRLQLKILKACFDICQKQGRRLILSLEMFELDVQRVLDEYVLQRSIREADFLQDARPWANYQRDYRPLVEFCREHGCRVMAANAPRRYVSLVSRGGDKALKKVLFGDDASVNSPLSLPPSGLPPLPLPSPSAAYRHKFIETIATQMRPPPEQSSSAESDGCPYIGFRSEDVAQVKDEMLQAQQLWDHSMAYTISRSLQCMEGETQLPLVVHVCGAFHCAHGLGIPEALPLYFSKSALAAERENEGEAHAASDIADRPWLPIDEVLEHGRSEHTSNQVAMSADSDEIAPKVCPSGVISVVCWPAAVAETKQVTQNGRIPESLGVLGNWAIITDEQFSERHPPVKAAKV